MITYERYHVKWVKLEKGTKPYLPAQLVDGDLYTVVAAFASKRAAQAIADCLNFHSEHLMSHIHSPLKWRRGHNGGPRRLAPIQ